MSKVLAISQVVLLEMLRRKDIYVLLIVTGVMTLLVAAVNIFNEARMVRYIKEISLVLIWISSLVIAIMTSARQLPAERENRTLFPLLAKPVSRTQFLLGKFAGCWVASGIALVSLYLVLVLLMVTREANAPVGSFVQALLLHWMALGIICALALLGSLFFNSVAANATICFFVVGGILLFGRYLKNFAVQLAEPFQSILMVVYYAVPHLELFDVRDRLVHSWPMIPWGPWSLALVYGTFFMALFLAAGCWFFRRKAVN